MDVDTLKAKMLEKLKTAPQVGAKVKFDLDGAVFWIDGHENPPVMHDGDTDEADTIFLCSPAVLGGIIDGTQDPTMAYMMGKLKIQGSMGYALKLNGFLSD